MYVRNWKYYKHKESRSISYEDSWQLHPLHTEIPDNCTILCQASNPVSQTPLSSTELWETLSPEHVTAEGKASRRGEVQHTTCASSRHGNLTCTLHPFDDAIHCSALVVEQLLRVYLWCAGDGDLRVVGIFSVECWFCWAIQSREQKR